MITLVFASSQRLFENWCWEQDISPRDPLVKYVRDFRDLRGLGQQLKIVVADEGFWERRDAEDLWWNAVGRQERYRDLPD